MTESQLIAACKKGQRVAQQQVYERYAAKMFGVCRRYIHNEADVEDVLFRGFFKVFDKIHTFQYKGSFEGWMRQIIVNESLMFLRKQKRNLHMFVEINNVVGMKTEATAEYKLATEDILRLLDELPTGYRTIFNLYAIEGYSHREIAKMLDISINTSKSQLLKARRMLQKLLTKYQYHVA